ncbi:hypothetical protein [Burkholderia territorii]|uniref:hypothetical protein n=1 Tax=Burkholderia territorii TaxID=1503055 RepID=UPI000B184519|nr:hypothetical protein [Burkholderia territorii]
MPVPPAARKRRRRALPKALDGLDGPSPDNASRSGPAARPAVARPSSSALSASLVAARAVHLDPSPHRIFIGNGIAPRIASFHIFTI